MSRARLFVAYYGTIEIPGEIMDAKNVPNIMFEYMFSPFVFMVGVVVFYVMFLKSFKMTMCFLVFRVTEVWKFWHWVDDVSRLDFLGFLSTPRVLTQKEMVLVV